MPRPFIAPFTDDADFVAFEGAHLKGREEITLFHQRMFETAVKASRIEGDVKFVRFMSPIVAVMHSFVAYAPGWAIRSPGLARFHAVNSC